MEKDIVTISRIKNDIFRVIFQSIIETHIYLLLIWFLVFILSTNYDITRFMICCSPIILTFLVYWIWIIYVIIKTLKGQFTIETDQIIRKRNKYGRILKRNFYRIYFKHCRYDIPNMFHYKWSKINAMYEREVFRTCHEGDYFTIIKINKKVHMIYNDRFFDVCVDKDEVSPTMQTNLYSPKTKSTQRTV